MLRAIPTGIILSYIFTTTKFYQYIKDDKIFLKALYTEDKIAHELKQKYPLSSMALVFII